MDSNTSYTVSLALLLAGAFLLGSVPFGVLFTRGSGIDLKKVGSGNTGATNVLRAAGKKAAALTLLCDILKGALPVAIARYYLGASDLWQCAVALAAVAGHDFSIFQRFKGGKGVATSIGVVLLYAPWAGLGVAVSWLLAVGLTRYSSMGALVSFGLMPLYVYYFGYGWEKAAFSVIITLLLFAKHSSNIRGLLSGTERKVGQKA